MDPNHNNKLLEGKRKIKIKQGFFRCLGCGNEAERLYPFVYNVTPETFVKISEMAEKYHKIRLISVTPADTILDKRLDDITLRPIHKKCFNVNIDVCMTCVKKIGYRHKNLFKFKHRMYATKHL